jgi:hypothetical protein
MMVYSTSKYEMPQPLRRMIDEVDELANLPENWDGYGSPPIQSAVRRTAYKLVELLDNLGLPNPHFAPVSGGGLQLEWQKEKRELELEIFPNGKVSFLMVEDSGEMNEGALPPDFQPDLSRLATWFKG